MQHISKSLKQNKKKKFMFMVHVTVCTFYIQNNGKQISNSNNDLHAEVFRGEVYRCL